MDYHGKLFFIFAVLWPIDSQHWYAAMLVENSSSFYAPQAKTDIKIPDSRDISVLKKITSKDFNGTEGITTFYPNLQETSRPTTPKTREESANSANITLPSRLWHTNTITNINVVKRYRPKRKTLRCPTVKPFKKGSKKRPGNKKAKFLEVFHVVQFDHVPCTSASGLEGTCLHEYDCGPSGGQSMGECADGYGTCCVVQLSCGDQTAAATGWFTNPGFPTPSSERLSCAATVGKSSPDVTQIRLDLLNFELLQPTGGSCEQDQFVVSGQNINSVIPILCGVNDGQHLYLEVSDVEGPIYLSVQTVTADSRLFAIKVTQLTSSDELAAPTGCLQYYTQPRGYLESFNYQETSVITIAKEPSYLNNLNYAMCIMRAPETCSITYTNSVDYGIPNYDTDGLPLIPPNQAGVEIFNCPDDWLMIAAARLCGERLNDASVIQDFSENAPVTDTASGPIVVWFRSDGSYVGRGFRLEYQQNSCSNNL